MRWLPISRNQISPWYSGWTAESATVRFEKVEQVIIEVATDVLKNNPEGVKDFTPSVKFKNFGGLEYQFFSRDEKRKTGPELRFETYFIKALHKRFQNEGIVMSIRSEKYIWTTAIPETMFNQSRNS